MLIKGVPLATKSRSLRERPALVAGRVGGVNKPTPVTLGAFAGYSFPIFASDDEECFFRNSVPRRWDGITNPTFTILMWLTSAETIGKKFDFQLSWNKVNPTVAAAIATATVIDVLTGDITLTDDNNDQYKIHSHTYTIDLDHATLVSNLAGGDDLVMRLRRVQNSAGAGSEITGEVVLFDWYITYQVDRVFSA